MKENEMAMVYFKNILYQYFFFSSKQRDANIFKNFVMDSLRFSNSCLIYFQCLKNKLSIITKKLKVGLESSK